ncbi:hypothetical protein TREMEDRAFT_62525 [Tremella mesenterica DSM 1558]|uniref:uncharacterized protein n=1 Tax=Tremella mesenterica (strain ATCC 24925 / CBS 8224 / DSM 1558 / NBRC 9311 / NRRL Y-6157 / RJB 2259-6 / UBC 559-6) TaxID=578456 RepID=UPI0003F4A47C|nr:uncharacterized protein TREMEDRAFT_62525 [Tremella mesenterica DSM 1558]EIW69656.1 hypothetical protein TREMEDRAFT_62525 [Tremella mesenterica DSM 1558]
MSNQHSHDAALVFENDMGEEGITTSHFTSGDTPTENNRMLGRKKNKSKMKGSEKKKRKRRVYTFQTYNGLNTGSYDIDHSDEDTPSFLSMEDIGMREVREIVGIGGNESFKTKSSQDGQSQRDSSQLTVISNEGEESRRFIWRMKDFRRPQISLISHKGYMIRENIKFVSK